MSVESLGQSYKLVPITVGPAQLLLDPNNPRIAIDLNADHRFTLAEIQKLDVQSYIRNALGKKSNRVTDLIRGMQVAGFTYGGGKIVVQKIGTNDKYLVLEGNRRTVAVQHLLASAKLSPIVHASLKNLDVEQFIFVPQAGHTEAEAIEHLMRPHMDGNLPWAALNRAEYAHTAYMHKLLKKFGASTFRYELDCANQVAAIFNCTPHKVRKDLIIFRIYQQLNKEEYDVDPEHYTLIDMLVSDRVVGPKYFGLSVDRFKLTNEGLSKFNRLCIHRPRPINNPGDFRKFAKIVKTGNERLIGLIERGHALDKVLELLSYVDAEFAFLDQLNKIVTLLEDLRVDQFKGTSSEKSVIRRIKAVVDQKLSRFL